VIYRLVFLSGASKGVHLTVEPEPMVIGTGEDCEIHADDSEMARRHAVIEQKSGSLWIRDLGSMNKILINGRELQKSQLKHGDVVELGRTRFLVQAAVQAEYEGVAIGGDKRKRRRRRTRMLLGLLVLTAAAYGWTRLRSPHPPDPIPSPGEAAPLPAVTQTVVVAETVTNVAFVTNIVVQTAALDVATTPATNEEMQAVLRELQGLKKIVTSMVATARSADGATSAVAKTVSPSPDGAPDPLPAKTRPVGDTLVPRRIHARVADVEQQRFQASDDYDAMRILRIRLGWKPDEAPDPADRVSVVVAFFEQNAGRSEAVPSRVTPPRRLTVPGSVWMRGTSTVVTASYVVPKGTLASDSAAARVGQFHGYVVRVCRGSEILDAYARPRALLNAEMPALE